MLETLLAPYGATLSVGEIGSRALWLAIREVAPFAASADKADWPLWRISTAPMHGPQVAATIAAQAEAEMLYDWAGGLVWVALPPLDDAGAALVRSAVRSHGGHAMLARAPRSLRAAVDVFEPQQAPLAALTQRVKESFDPKRILGPGRMYAGV
jgi:glycolate oxidase FAD binding subunit